ncbi:HEPN domain-containing protein [Mucilaginibacter sp.]|uniref:HEPN domain-containing protein n=1 Tax=Mucilaginibacter sp. TaxID=1882438 RepID=UPI002622FE79|nr:HEPN domain-containing protein [Mucilaginibacter sp.]MDB4924457.1 hypothetical protein [Mucilaginibacter sp.]
MAYSDRFISTDNLIINLTPYLSTITDSAILASYAGFLSVSSITVYELAIKDIFSDFATRKHLVFGHFVEKYLSRINGQIKLGDLKGNQIKVFGGKYLQKFETSVNSKEALYLLSHGKSLKSSYDNLIICRHVFVHRGNPTLTINEVVDNYHIGKEIIHSLFDSMKR